MDLRQQAKNVANQGRFGDSMLLHVNPVEMKGLASAMPLTVNPQTGQPEAFLPFLAPILGSVLGKAFLGNALGNIAASAIGSGLAQTAATGDVRKGLLAGLTGFGLGQFLNKLPIAGADIAGQTVAESAAQTAGQPLTTEATKEIIAEAGAKNIVDAATSSAFNPVIADSTKEFLGKELGQEAIANLANPSGLEVGAKATLSALSDPSVYIPTGIGMGTTGAMISQEELEEYIASLESPEERAKRLQEMYPEMVPIDITGMQEGGTTKNIGDVAYEAGKQAYYNYLAEQNPAMPDYFGDEGLGGGGAGVPTDQTVIQPGMFSPTQSASYRQFYGSAGMGVPSIIDPTQATQGFTVDPFVPEPIIAPFSDMTARPEGNRGGRRGSQQGTQTPDYFGDGDLTRGYVPRRFANPIPTGFIPGFSPEFSYFGNVNPTAGEIDTGTDTDTDTDTGTDTDTDTGTGPDGTGTGDDETRTMDLETPLEYDDFVASLRSASGLDDLTSRLSALEEGTTSATDVPDYSSQLAELQALIEANQQAIAGLPTVDTSGFATQDQLAAAISGIPSFDPSGLQSDISSLQTGLAGLQGQFQGFTPFDPTAIQNQLAALQEAQTGFAQDLGGLQGQFQGFTPFDPSNIASQISDLQTGLAGLQGQFQGFSPSPTTISFDDIQGAPDFSQFATQTDLSNIPQFDPTSLQEQIAALQQAQTGFAQDLGGLEGQFQGFTPSPTTINFSDIQGVPDFSQFATQQDLSSAISGVPQFDPSTLGLPDFSQFATQQDLSTAISGVPQFDPSTLGLPDFSQFATQADLSNIPQFDPSNILSQLSDLQTGQTGLAQDVGNLQGQFQGFTPFDPSTLNLPDFSQFATQQDLSNIPQFDPTGILSQLSNLQQAQTGFAQDLGGLQGQFEGFTPTPTTINFGDIQGVPDFSQFATTDQLFDPSTLNLPDFSQFATTDQLFDASTLPDFSQFLTAETAPQFNPSYLQDQIDALEKLLGEQGANQAEEVPQTPKATTSTRKGRAEGGSLKAVPKENKGLAKLPEDVRNKMGFMAPGGDTKFPDLTGDGKVTQADILKGRGVDLKQEGGITQAMLDDPLTNQVAQFILGNETNDEVVSAFIDKYGSNAFREIRRAVLKTLAPNAQTEGMIKGSLAGGMEDDIFGVIGDPNKNGQRVAVSQDEFIVPADVVSMLGDGSSDAGANKLERMMDRIRTEKTNTTKQARPINDKRVLPA